MFDLDRLAEWDLALARLEEAATRHANDANNDKDRSERPVDQTSTRQEPRAA